MKDIHIPAHEIQFRTSRSGGPGGQHVNKVESRVELLFDVAGSTALTDEQKDLVRRRLRHRVDEHGILRLVVQESRSQWENKRKALERLTQLLRTALVPVKQRLPTKPTARARARRVEKKKKRGELKRLRKSIDGE